MWPVASKQWTQFQRTQHVTKVLQHVTPGMYFGEAEVLKGGTVSCRVSVASQRAILLGFPKDALEMFMDTKTRRDWLENHVIVKFPHEQETRHDAIV